MVPRAPHGDEVPQGHPKRLFPLWGGHWGHPAHAGTHQTSPWLSSHSLGTVSGATIAQDSAGEAGAPRGPSSSGGLTARGITAEAWHTRSMNDLKAGARPRPTPRCARVPRAAAAAREMPDAKNPTVGRVARKATGFSRQHPRLDLSPLQLNFGHGVLEAAAAAVPVASTKHHAGITSGDPTESPTQCQSMEEQLTPCQVHSPRASSAGTSPSP